MKQHQRRFQLPSCPSVSFSCLLAVPEEPPGGGRWPLLMYLHGKGECGDDPELVRRHGPPRLIARGRSFPFILAAPQCRVPLGWPAEPLTALLDALLRELPVDPDRVYLTGLSMGGFGVWSLATLHPERFAAIVPICGGGAPYLAERLRALPIWAFHGARDDVVPLEESLRMVKAVNRAGGDARLTIYPEVGHDSWTATYENPEVYAWMLRHTRKPSA